MRSGIPSAARGASGGPDPSPGDPSLPASLLDELKRRKVWRTIGTYLAGALTVLLAVAELYDDLGLPEGTPRLVAALVVAGLPLAAALAWFLDVGRDGGGIATAGGPDAREALSPDAVGMPDPSGRASVLVLPFDNFSPDEGDAFFSNGLTEEITANLAHIRSLRVISRTSAMALKATGDSTRDMHRKHGVDYVLEGSVRKAGSSIRITAQLIQAGTDEHLWAEHYDGILENVFQVQEEVSRSIAKALALRLRPEEERHLHERPVQDLKAWELVLRARDALFSFQEEGLDRAREYLQAARTRVGENALILSGLGYVEVQRANLGLGHEEAIEAARRHAERALELDPRTAQAHLVLGTVHLGADADVTGGIRHLHRCLEITPDDAHALLFLNIGYGLRGRVRAMKAIHARLEAADPLSPMLPGAASLIPWTEGRYEEALRLARGWRESLADQGPIARLMEVTYLAWSGRTEEARDVVRRELGEDAPDSPSQLCLLFAAAIEQDDGAVRRLMDGPLQKITRRDPQFGYIALSALALVGERDEVVERTRHMLASGVVNHPWFAELDPFLTRLRGDSGYEAVLEEMRPLWEAEVDKGPLEA